MISLLVEDKDLFVLQQSWCCPNFMRHSSFSTRSIKRMIFQCKNLHSVLKKSFQPSHKGNPKPELRSMPLRHPGNCIKIKMPYCQYGKSHYEEKMVPMSSHFWLWQNSSMNSPVRLSVFASVEHTFLQMLLSLYHHDIFRSNYHCQKWCPCKRLRSEVKGQGHRCQNKFCPNLGISRLQLQFEYTDDYRMMHKARHGIEEMPYCLGHSSNFKVTWVKNLQLALIWAFLDDNLNLNSWVAMKWHT